MLGELVGSYRVERKLGEGGMGVVYIAEHPLLRKKAVVKFLHAELSSRADVVERFFNEARSATLIRHPGIVDVFDFGHHASGCAFILMEFLDGESLADRVREAPLDAAVTCLVGRQIANALAAAHEQQIVHRDLKPDNIFLVRDREAIGGARVKVLDFGIAKLAGDSAGAVKTQTGTVMGTPSYMAPEQCRSAGHVDHRADIYSLGCILFEMVCGRPPFQTTSLGQLIAAHMFETPPAPTSFAPALPPALEAVILRALAKDAGLRQQSMAELAAELVAAAPPVMAPIQIWTTAQIAIAATSSVGLAATAAAPSGAQPAAASLDEATLPPPSPKHQTTLNGASGQLAVPATAIERARPRRRWWIAPVGVAVATAGGIAIWQVAASGHGTESNGSGSGSQIASALPADATTPDAAATPPPMPPDAPSQITLVIDSDPQGASVIREVDGVNVGKTHFERKLAPVAGGTLVYIVKLKGFEDERVELAADRDDKQAIKLRPRGTSTASKPPGSGGATTTTTQPSTTTDVGNDGMVRPNYDKRKKQEEKTP